MGHRRPALCGNVIKVCQILEFLSQSGQRRGSRERDTDMRIIIGADHAGFALKGPIVNALREWGHEVEDVGTHGPEPIDFPVVARRVCGPVRAGDYDRGVMVCGTGIGACMAANKIPGIRAALCHDVYSAHQSVEHDDANIICLGAQIVGDQLAYDLLRAYLAAEMSTEEHFQRRVRMLADMEREAAKEIRIRVDFGRASDD